jgi:predicted transcriptional regulator
MTGETEIDELEQTKTGQIFIELSSEVRRTMLLKLNERSLKLSEIAKELNITKQHAHTNVNRLTDIGLIEKNSNGSLFLTTYGKAIITHLPSFQFLGEHKEYFQDHSFGSLPLKFKRRIGDLNNGSFVKGVVAILQQWKLMYQEAGEYIHSIIPQVPVDLIEPLAEKINAGIKFSYILPKDAVVPAGTSEITKKVSWQALLAERKTERRMVDKVLVATIVTDKSAGVLFPNARNETDMNVMFYSKDAVFHEWCQDYFRYMWHSSDLFEKTKLESAS